MNYPIQKLLLKNCVIVLTFSLLFTVAHQVFASDTPAKPHFTTKVSSCDIYRDTIVFNNCPSAELELPWRKYAGYNFYGAQPFKLANIIDPAIPVTATHIYWAYFDDGNGCRDTVRISAVINGCADIDDDNDGIPDYVEFNNPLALGDANGNGIPNWNDPTYAGYIDHNNDNVNDNFDYGADADNDGIPNFYDASFPGFVDSNLDGVNDNSDADKDGIPNQYDLDSDNDGIPDVVESYGVDTDGDGVIDNYTDTDEDGLSQNVDGSNSGVDDSASGLGTPNFDGDALPNYLDLDSDNDGIPDLVEPGGKDMDNNGRVDNFIDLNGDGLTDDYTHIAALLKTGIDVSPLDGRADNFPFKNLDRDFRPNGYDVDADGDGIVDVIEAGLPDANRDGKVDGTINAATNGWSSTVSVMAALNLRNTDGSGNPDYLDIDADDDGIPDNIEGQATGIYKLPALTDADGDGLVTPYDNVSGFSGSGILVYDHDGDGIPDYRDLDADADGQPDIIEGNDFNLNGYMDDNVTLTGLDTDGDGLDNRFDSLNSVTNIKGTSYRMGTNGSLTGDASPGSRATVQKRVASQIDRDWRSVGMVLPVQFLNFTGVAQNMEVPLSWLIITSANIERFEVERSQDNITYNKMGEVTEVVKINEQQNFTYTDNITGVTAAIIYYRLKVIGKYGGNKYSNILVVRRSSIAMPVSIMPNPAHDYTTISFFAEKASAITLRLVDNSGKTMLLQKQKVLKGNNALQLNRLSEFSPGIYILQVYVNEEFLTQKLVIAK